MVPVLAPIPEEVVPMAAEVVLTVAVEVGTVAVVAAVAVVGLARGEGAAGEDIKQPVLLGTE